MANDSITLNTLLQNNIQFVRDYQSNGLMKFISSHWVEDEIYREHMLDAIQTLSNFFQKIIMLRYVFTDDSKFNAITLEHLKEEFCHHERLMEKRDYRPATWDPILESGCSWFLWRMFNTNDEEKTVLIHLVLEASANVFFQVACPIMRPYGKGNYFAEHDGADEKHEKMGEKLLENLSPSTYHRLAEIQKQGWSIMLMISQRIAELSLDKKIP